MAEEMISDRQVNTLKPVLHQQVGGWGNWWIRIISLSVYVAVYFIFFRHATVWILALLGIVLLHELGHFTAMKYFRYRDVKIFFIPFLGAFVSGEPRVASQQQKVITLFAGPLPGILLGLACLALAEWIEQNRVVVTLGVLLIGLNAVNLVPVKPLDGGQLLEKLVPDGWHIVQTVTVIGMAAAMFVWAIKGSHYMGLAACWYALYRLRTSLVIFSIRSQLRMQGLRYDLVYEQLSDQEYLDMRKVVIPKVYALRHFHPAEVDADNEERVAIWVDKVLTGVLHKDMTGAQVWLSLIIWGSTLVISTYIVARHFDWLSIFKPQP